MNKSYFIIISISIFFLFNCSDNPKTDTKKTEHKISQKEQYKTINPKIQKLIGAYPEFIIGYKENLTIWKDSSTMIFDDSIEKNFDKMLDFADIEDMFAYDYIPFEFDTPQVNYDPGRIRNEEFFKKMYGNSETEVRKNLVEIIWLPNTLNQKIWITKINGVNEKLQQISNELDSKPELHKYLKNIGGTFNWRKIANTNRLSVHSFGIAIDINVEYSNYWLWSKKTSDELNYQNRIPLEIVNIFEKYGFIWGGKWYHFDTMHFEYRPELL